MARLLVVSRSMALAMRIADDHEVVEYPVEALDDLAPEPDVDAVVLDLGEPHTAMQTLDRLRSRGYDTRVLIVSGYQPAWNDLVALSIDRVFVVPLPITRAALLDGIDRLLEVTPFVPRVPPAASPPAAPPPALPVRPVPGGPRGPGSSPVRPAPPAPEPATTAGTGTPGGTRRPGLARWLTTAPPPPVGRAPQGSPLDAGSATRRSAPGAPAGAPQEGDLFHPVVEPDAPVRPPATLPSRPQRPAPMPPAGAPAPARPQTEPAGSPPLAAPGPLRRPPVRSAPAVAPAFPAARTVPAPPAPAPGPAPGPPPAAAPAAPAPPPAAPAAAPTAAPAAPGAAPRGPERAARALGRLERGGRDRRDPWAQHPGFTPAAGLRAAPVPVEEDPESAAVDAAVRTLLDRRSELFGVAETAQVLADEVIERGEADAAAVLVPDGGRWRVGGGVGLRPLERRLLLDTSHWLIAEIAVGGRALLIEDTDIVRPRLAGAPLAAWRHLLAVPVASLRAAVVLARGQEAARFTEKDLAAVVPLVAEAKPLLAAALRMRELARTLGPLRDLDG